MIPIGVVSNPSSGRNLRSGLGVTADAARDAGALHRVLDHAGQVTDAIAAFARARVGLIVVDGGDGTVRAVLAAIRAEPAFATPPLLVALASGTTNLIAGDVGARGDRGRAFARLVERARNGDFGASVVSRAPLLVQGRDGAPEIGFFFGAGALAFGTRLTRRAIERGRLANTAGTVLGIAATSLCLLAGGRRGALATGTPMTVACGEAPGVAGNRFLLLATTLERLVLGLHPFWGTGPGAINLLDIAAPPRRFARALPALLRARPRPWMAPTYRSARTDRVTLALDAEALLDGEWFRPEPGRPVVLAAGAPVRFVRP